MDDINRIPKNKQEEQLFINPNNYYLNNKSNRSYFCRNCCKRGKQRYYRSDRSSGIHIFNCGKYYAFLLCPCLFYKYVRIQTTYDKRRKRMEKNLNKRKKLLNISLGFITIFLILIFIIYFIKKSNNDNDNDINPDNIYLINNSSIVYNNKNIKDSDFSKYQNMLPHLTPDLNVNSSIEEIFNARQIYISDVKITPEYIKYIRPINETEEEKYKKRYSENETVIDKNLFPRRFDQFDYNYYCQMALAEKLIYERKIKTDNKPLISVVITSYNKYNILLKSIRSIQNQKFTNIEIIIVNDCSTDNSTYLFNYLLKTDSRIRIFHHTTNMGCWRSRLDGIIYSRGKYVILFDTGDLYEDNYVLLDAYNVIEKYNLDSCKFLFRIIRSFKSLNNSGVFFHVGKNDKIVYEPQNIYSLNSIVFSFWGNIWNRLVRANIYTKALLSINEMLLNIYKNTWDDVWFNKILNNVSYSYAIFERSGYVYLQNGYGEGSPGSATQEQRSKSIKEYVGFLCFNHYFSGHDKKAKALIINKLQDYNETHKNLRLQNFRNHFEVLNNLLEALIKDPDLPEQNITYCKQLLEESKIREIEVKKNISKKVKPII